MSKGPEELLEDYLDALSSDPNAPVPDALAPDLAEFTRQLALTRRQEIQDRVWRKTLLLAQSTKKDQPFSDDMPIMITDINNRLIKRRPRTSYISILLAAAALLVLVWGLIQAMRQSSKPTPTNIAALHQTKTSGTALLTETPYPYATATLKPTPASQFLPLTPNRTPQVIGPDNRQHLRLSEIVGKGDLKQVAWSPDQMQVVVASTTGIWLYKADALDQPGQLLHDGYPGDAMMTLVFNPTGDLLASSNNTTVMLWDIEAGQAKAVLPGMFGGSALAFSPNGQTLATANHGVITLWDVATGTDRLSWQNTSYSLAFSPDGNTIASGDGDNIVRLWDVKTGTKQGELIPPPSTSFGIGTNITAVAFSPSGQILASGGSDNYVRIWDLQNKVQKVSRADETIGVKSVAFSRNGNAVAYLGDTAWLWQYNTDKAPAFLDKSTRWYGLVFNNSNDTALALGVSGSGWRLWGMPSIRRKPY